MSQPFVSVIVPVKNRPEATRELVRSFIDQTYPTDQRELIIVGDVDDQTWSGIVDLTGQANIRLVEANVRSDGRDANAKRNVGLVVAEGEILVLTDSDMVLPVDWVEKGVKLLAISGHQIVAGGANSVSDSFLAGYVDRNMVGSKTSRMDPSYVLTTDNAGKGRYKHPVTANLFFTRGVYERVGGLPDFVEPYEDFPYADDMLWAGYSILCTSELDALHTHRDTPEGLAKEYYRAGVGCADYVLRYGESHLAKARVKQLIAVTVLTVAWIALLAVAPLPTIAVTAALAALGSAAMAIQLRSAAAVWYLGITVILSALFSAGMLRGFAGRMIKAQGETRVLHSAEMAITTVQIHER